MNGVAFFMPIRLQIEKYAILSEISSFLVVIGSYNCRENGIKSA